MMMKSKENGFFEYYGNIKLIEMALDNIMS
jgi:hypothetical protein